MLFEILLEIYKINVTADFLISYVCPVKTHSYLLTICVF